jgi:hypothetical protein
MIVQQDLTPVERIVSELGAEPHAVIPILQAIQTTIATCRRKPLNAFAN